MLQASPRTALSGPALIRLLTRLADVDVPESRLSLSDRLSQWLGWTDAIALSSALNGQPPAVAANARAAGRVEDDEGVRVRSLLSKAIVNDSVLSASKRRAFGPAYSSAQGGASVETPVDYAVFRQRYIAQQQSMETALGNLRGRLRGMLATRTPAMARLAAVDAVMERALGERERTLLASVPGLLAGHFERLREASLKAGASDGDAADVGQAARHAAPPAPDAWLDVFRKDMLSVLLAELEVRLQPVEGLLAALRTR